MLQFADSTFSETFITTVGIDYKYKYMDAKNEKTGKVERIRLEIWDTAGQERFKAITRSYLRGAEGILLVYDITDPPSFDDVKSWIRSKSSRQKCVIRYLSETNVIWNLPVRSRLSKVRPRLLSTVLSSLKLPRKHL